MDTVSARTSTPATRAAASKELQTKTAACDFCPDRAIGFDARNGHLYFLCAVHFKSYPQWLHAGYPIPIPQTDGQKLIPPR